MKEKKLYLFDLDGTLILGKEIIDGTLELLEEIKRQGKEYMIFTNNSSRTRAQYVEKLARLGIEINEEDVATAGYIVGEYLVNHKKEKVFVVGTEKFRELLSSFGIEVIENPQKIDGKYDLDALIIGLDSELNYKKLTTACDILAANPEILYLGANPDMVYPVEDGVFYPDCGSICKLLSYSTKREPKFLGKPYSEIIDFCLKEKGVTKDETVIIGDRLYTDIACGVKNGCDTILVLTGEAKIEDVKDTKFPPTLVLESIKEIKL